MIHHSWCISKHWFSKHQNWNSGGGWRPNVSAIHDRYLPTSVKTVYLSLPQPPPETPGPRPQLVTPTTDHPWWARSWVTRGPPESPWQPPFLVGVVLPAHNCFLLILNGKYGRSSRLLWNRNSYKQTIIIGYMQEESAQCRATKLKFFLTFLVHSWSVTIGILALLRVLDQSPPSSTRPHPDNIVRSQPP